MATGDENKVVFAEAPEPQKPEGTYKGESRRNLEDIVAELAHKVSEQVGKLEKTEKILYLGFLVLLVMVATLVVIVFQIVLDAHRDRNDSYKEVIQKIETLNHSLESKIGIPR
jgi:cell division protein FtsL